MESAYAAFDGRFFTKLRIVIHVTQLEERNKVHYKIFT